MDPLYFSFLHYLLLFPCLSKPLATSLFNINRSVMVCYSMRLDTTKSKAQFKKLINPVKELVLCTGRKLTLLIYKE